MLIGREATLARLQIYQNESARTIGLRDQLRVIAEAIQSEKSECAWHDRSMYCLDNPLATELAWFSQKLEPYHLVVIPVEEQVVGSAQTPEKGYSNADALPTLSKFPYSRERGELLEILAREKVVNAILQTADARNEPRLSFERAYLPSGVLYGADLTNANLRRAWLPDSQMEGAVAFHAHFDHANLAGVDLQFSILLGSSFEAADLSGAFLDHSNLSDCQLVMTNLRGASLEKADLSNASLILADLRGASFAEATISDKQIQGACVDDATLQANDREYLKSSYVAPASCDLLWPEEPPVEGWVLFSEESPPLGALIQVKAAAPGDGAIVLIAGRWNGEVLVTDEGAAVLSGGWELVSWKHPNRLLLGRIASAPRGKPFLSF